ncbi:MAG: (2Fe-2S) ferredoxin domain-containing protein [Candidatus Aenigmarchaeota archaeon]|nr:(2Fe-2S) ferredoxin domain-containing protein [Candidatus Aenigmarchaeota archaeon]
MLPANANPQKHIIVCCNTREQGDCCGKIGGEELYLKLKEYIKTNGLVGKVWVTRARCLGFCNPAGATVVIYPDNKWFSHVTLEDFEEIKEMIIS